MPLANGCLADDIIETGEWEVVYKLQGYTLENLATDAVQAGIKAVLPLLPLLPRWAIQIVSYFGKRKGSKRKGDRHV